MITCNFCGDTFSTVKAFEKHIESELTIEKDENILDLGTQILYPDGKIEFKGIGICPRTLRWLSDGFLQRKKSDKDFTEP